jgi:hypothetical protein
MKRKKMNRLLILGCFFTTLVLNAQEQIIDCKQNIQEALFYLKGSTTIEKDSLKTIEYLKPCLEAKNPNA